MKMEKEMKMKQTVATAQVGVSWRERVVEIPAAEDPPSPPAMVDQNSQQILSQQIRGVNYIYM